MPRTSKTDQELAYLRSAWEEAEDQAIELGFITQVRLLPTISRGVWTIEISAHSKEVDERGVPVYFERAVHRFPNGRNVMFAGEFWAVLHRFGVQLEDAREALKRAPSDG